ncbi:MAG: glycosyltransferase, partial [Thauera sp.]
QQRLVVEYSSSYCLFINDLTNAILPVSHRVHKGYKLKLRALRSEGFARGCAEAMLAGTPVVSTRCSGPADYISNGMNGFLADIGDFESLASATCKILETPTLAEEFVKRARLDIREHYNPDSIRLKWNRLFEDSIVNFKNNDSSSALACQLVTNTFTQLGQTQVRLDEFERRLEVLETLHRLIFDNKIATRIKAIVSRFRTATTA